MGRLLFSLILFLGLLAGFWALFSQKAPLPVEEMPNGRQFYAAPDGAASGDGTMNLPWDLATALGNTRAIKPGDVLNLRGGTYHARGGDAQFRSKLAGEKGKYVLVRPRPGEQATIAGGIEIDGPYVIFRDFEVTGNNPDRVSEQATSFPTDVLQSVGFNVFAPNVRVVNNIVHDHSAGLDSWVRAPDNEFYGNLVYYNGWRSVDRGHGHGLYMQNTSGVKYVRDNIVFSQFASGMHFYGSDQADLNNFYVEGNIAFNNGILNNEHQRNILLGGGRVAQNPVVKDNYMYFSPEGTLGGDHNIGYNPFGLGCSNAKITGNYFVADGPALNLFKCTVDSLEGNTLYGEIKGFDPKQYPDNKYYDRIHPPKGIDVFVRRNKFELGRANIVIFNWDHADTVNVDVSGTGLESGDRYILHSAQDYFGDVVTATLAGTIVRVSMVNRSVALPIGVKSPPSTFPQFGVFIIRKVPSSTN